MDDAGSRAICYLCIQDRIFCPSCKLSRVHSASADLDRHQQGAVAAADQTHFVPSIPQTVSLFVAEWS